MDGSGILPRKLLQSFECETGERFYSRNWGKNLRNTLKRQYSAALMTAQVQGEKEKVKSDHLTHNGKE